MSRTEHLHLSAAQELAARRRQQRRGERLPPELRPENLTSAWQIQCAVSDLLDNPVAGWKCGMPASGKLVLAPIYANTVFDQTGLCPLLPIQGQARIEPELAYMLKHDLPPRTVSYSEAEIDATIGATRLALELIGSRYTAPDTASFEEHLADGLFNQGLYLGPVIAAGEAESNELHITLQADGETVQQFEGKHPAGQARAPLYWLVEFLHKEGIGLRAGQAIITGSYAGSPDVALEKNTVIQFGKLGQIQTRFCTR